MNRQPRTAEQRRELDRTLTKLRGLFDTATRRGPDVDGDARALRNLIALSPYANPELLPRFPEHRRRELAPLLGYGVWQQVFDRGHRRRRVSVPAQRQPTDRRTSP